MSPFTVITEDLHSYVPTLISPDLRFSASKIPDLSVSFSHLKIRIEMGL